MVCEGQLARPPVQHCEESVGRLCEYRLHTTLFRPEVAPDRARREPRGRGDVIPARRGYTSFPEQGRGVPRNSQPRLGMLRAGDGRRSASADAFLRVDDGCRPSPELSLSDSATLSLSDSYVKARRQLPGPGTTGGVRQRTACWKQPRRMIMIVSEVLDSGRAQCAAIAGILLILNARNAFRQNSSIAGVLRPRLGTPQR